MARFSPPLFALLVFLSLSFLLYAPGIKAPFYFDDRPLLSPLQGEGKGLASLPPADLLAFPGVRNRPVAALSFALNAWALGDSPAAFRVVNVALHGVAALAIFLLVGQAIAFRKQAPSTTARQEKSEGGLSEEAKRLLPWAAALLWLASPVQTQPVIYIVQRMSLLSSACGLYAVYLYGRARGDGGLSPLPFAASLALFLLALGSKETAIVVPAILVLYELLVVGPATGGRKRAGAAVFLVLGLAAAALFVRNISTAEPRVLDAGLFQVQSGREYSGIERWAFQPRVALFYLSLALLPLPSRLSLEHDLSAAGCLGEPATWLGWALSLLVVAYLWRTRRRALLVFTLASFAVAILPESAFLNLSLVYEHRLYLPSTGIYAVLAAGLLRLGDESTRGTSRTLAAFPLAALALLSVLTVSRVTQWNDPVGFYRDTVSKAPRLTRPRYQLAAHLQLTGRPAEALGIYEEILEKRPDHEESCVGRGKVLSAMGRHGEAAQAFGACLERFPLLFQAHLGLGLALLKGGRTEEAARALARGELLRPEKADLPAYLGVALKRLGRRDAAEKALRRSLALDPRHVPSLYNLGRLALGEGRRGEAEVLWRRALDIDPGNTQVRLGLAGLLVRKGRPKEAAAEYRRVLERAPRNNDARRALEALRSGVY